MVPISQNKKDKSVTVAMAEPQNPATLDSLRQFLGVEVKGSVASEEDVKQAIGRLYEFCRTQIKNLSYEDSGYTPDQIEKLKFNKSSTDTLANGYGTAAQINMLFGALLRASGRSP